MIACIKAPRIEGYTLKLKAMDMFCIHFVLLILETISFSESHMHRHYTSWPFFFFTSHHSHYSCLTLPVSNVPSMAILTAVFTILDGVPYATTMSSGSSSRNRVSYREIMSR